ncbi:hypothetical protein EVAR_35699_1 [Eumeta japonica]|uniref:DUF5641 domain-containing protein n=1 Tax=Eumeta variegata TaxID=151549 RepID=A0A4C1VEL2_EUMVA|nr:hypothetical protein EVAR_35699_1 [Eumeta japonica]
MGCANHLPNHACRTPRDSSQFHTVVCYTRTPSLHGTTRHADRDVPDNETNFTKVDKELKEAALEVEKAQTREETLHTLLLEVGHIINSRPLTPVEPDLNREALTPYHFLIGRSCSVSTIVGHLEPKVEDLVLIADKTMPRRFWPRGRVIKTIPGRDNKVRVVEIQAKLGILKRPTSRQVVLTWSLDRRTAK